MGFSFGGSAETRTPVLLVLPIKDYTFRILFKLTIQNFTIPLFYSGSVY
jgi:hypothetical protein